MRLRNDRLAVSVYAKHGDTCPLAPNCQSLGCASGYLPTDYVLSARFAYLQEALDYAQAVTARGVSIRIVSKIGPTPYISDYPKAVLGYCQTTVGHFGPHAKRDTCDHWEATK